jgi:uncharacterized protein YndB with AHSA1/START domain
MPDIFHYLTIKAPIEKIFESFSTPKGLDIWWSKSSTGKPGLEQVYQLCFGPEYNWSAIVSKYVPGREFELTITDAHADWTNTKVGFSLINKNNWTEVHFYHAGWQQDNEHYRISCYCWAMYLRILKRNLEFGEEVPYEDRLNV